MFYRFKSFSRIALSLAVVAAVIVVGSVGFMLLEGYTFIEAFYMTMITVSTVGFREVHELSPNGMVFTSLLIIFSIGTFAYTISAITTYFVTGEYRDLFKARKLERTIDNLKDHVIVCGYGRVGEKAYADLTAKGYTAVIVEKDEELVGHLRDDLTPLVIAGDATRDDRLIAAGVDHACAVICTLPSDADNLYTVLSVREHNPKAVIISRASQAGSQAKLRRAGADNVIMPDTVGGAHMASLVANPDVMDFIDHIRIQGKDAVNLEEVDVKDLPPEFRLPTLGEVDARNRIGVNVIGVKTSEGEFIINPGPETPLDNACKLFVLGSDQQLRLLNRLFGLQSPE
ncbi:MAG: NAD-binding protein [Flavobacteriales bacterium]|nr:NAD-binding protein [Flavobacteriales bacterium]